MCVKSRINKQVKNNPAIKEINRLTAIMLYFLVDINNQQLNSILILCSCCADVFALLWIHI